MTRTTYAYWIRGRDFAELAAKSIESIRRIERFMVDRRFVIVTDEPPQVLTCKETGQEYISAPWRDLFNNEVEIHHIGRGDRPAMVANLDAQLEVLFNTRPGERVLFLDADTLLLQPFPWTKSDIHATWRDHVNGNEQMAREQPWNYGVLGANVTPAVIEAFVWLRQRILKMAPRNQDWYGNQLALADLLGAAREQPYETAVRWTHLDRGTPLTVQPLPCDVWNYAPNAPDEDVSGKGILHFKGESRKHLMEAYSPC